MGEGCLLERNPSPIRVRGHIIAPSPARGEGTRGKSHAFWRNEPNRHFGQTKPANVASSDCGIRSPLRSIVSRLLFYNEWRNSNVSKPPARGPPTRREQ